MSDARICNRTSISVPSKITHNLKRRKYTRTYDTLFCILQTDASEISRRSVEVSPIQIKRIGQQSDGSEFDYFKRNLLQPFLITRVSDTEGNRRVQQACNIRVVPLSV